MTSQELKNAKATLINNVNNYLSQFNHFTSQMNIINDTFAGSTDTLLNNEMINNSTQISEKISSTITEINNKTMEAVAKINLEIARLEEYERQQLLLKQEKEEQEGV